MKTILALLCALPLAAQSPQSLSLKSQNWKLYTSPYATGGKGQLPLTASGGVLAFNFPDSSSGTWANYFYTTHVPKVLSGTLSITIRVETSGPTVFDPHSDGEVCDPMAPPAVHPFFWANGFSLFVPPYNDRWWANSVQYVLAPGTVTMLIPLTPDNWLNVNGSTPGGGGSATVEAFNAALANPSAVGVTLGGNCSFGHGVAVSGGTASFTLIDYSILP